MNKKKVEGKRKRRATHRNTLNCLLCNTLVYGGTPKKQYTPALHPDRTDAGLSTVGHSLYSVKSLFSKAFKLDDVALETLDSSEINLCDLCVNKFLTLIHTQQKVESLLVSSIQSYAAVISDTLLGILAQSTQQKGELAKPHDPETTTLELSSSNSELEVTHMAVKLFLESTLCPGENPKEFDLIGIENLKGRELNLLRESMITQMEEIKLLLRRTHENAGTPRVSQRSILMKLILGIDEITTHENINDEMVDKLHQEAIVRLEECQIGRAELGDDDKLEPQLSTITAKVPPCPKRSRRIVASPRKRTPEANQNIPAPSSSRPKRKVTIPKRVISATTQNSKGKEGVVLLKPGFLKQFLDRGHFGKDKGGIQDVNNKSESSTPNLPLHLPRAKSRTAGPRSCQTKKAEAKKQELKSRPPKLRPSSRGKLQTAAGSNCPGQKNLDEEGKDANVLESSSQTLPLQPPDNESGTEFPSDPPTLTNPKRKRVNGSFRKGRVMKTRRRIRVKIKKPNRPETSTQGQRDSDETVEENVGGNSKSESEEIEISEKPNSENDLDQSLLNLANEVSQNLNKEKDGATIGCHGPPSVIVKYEVITLSDSECSIKSENRKQRIKLQRTKEDFRNKIEQTLTQAKRKKLWTQKYFKYITNIKKRRHKSTRIFKCKACDKFYKSEVRLQNHQLKHAPGYYSYVCTEAGCLKKFTDEAPFLRHKHCHMLSAQRKLKLAKIASRKKMREANVLMYPCMFCNFSTKSRSRAEKHMEVSHNERYKKNIHLVRARADELELKHHERLLAMESEPTEGPMEKEIEAGNTTSQKQGGPDEGGTEVQPAPSATKTTYGELFPSSQYINCPTCYKLFANLEQYVNHFCDYRKAPFLQPPPPSAPAILPAYSSAAPQQWPSTVVSAQGYQISWVPLSQAPTHQTPSAYYTPYVPATYNWNQYGANQFQNYPQTQNTNSNGNGYGNLPQGVQSSQYVLPPPAVTAPVPVISSDIGPLPPKQVSAEFTFQDLIQFEETLDELTTL